MTEPGMVARAAHSAEDRRGHRLVWMFIGVTLAGLVALTVALLQQGFALGDLRAEAAQNGQDARTLARQVEDLGGVPAVEPPPAPADPDDPEDQDAEIQDAERQDPENQDPERQDPENQDPSIPGVSGVNGRDGESPPCMSEPAQCRGERGEKGDRGDRGEPGETGPPGPTCPDGYTARSRTYDPTPVVPGGEETWWVCVADGGQT